MTTTPFSFATSATIRFGRGTLAEAAPYALSRTDRILVVRSASVAAADELVQTLRTGSEVLEILARGEPDLPGVVAACDDVRSFAPGLIVAIGGGATIDFGKALAALVPALREPLCYLEVVGEGRPLDASPLPVVAIPTTAGTGAEVTRNAVIQIPGAGRKVSLRDPRLLPALALVDPDLAESCPPHVTLASGLDAITQVIEPFVSTRANPITDALCRDAIPRGLKALRQILDTKEKDAWDDMVLTSVFGGVALANSGLGAVHGLAGVIGGITGAPHGAICGSLLPHVLRMNRRVAPNDSVPRPRLDWVIQCISDVYGGLDDFQKWCEGKGLPTISDLGVQLEMHGKIAADALDSSSFSGNPVPLDEFDLANILHSAQ